MRVTTQRNDAIDVLQPEGSSELFRRHSAFKAVPDACAPQVDSGEKLRKSEGGASACDFRIDGRETEGATLPRLEYKPFGRTGNGIKVAVQDRLNPARKVDATGGGNASRRAGEVHFRMPACSNNVGYPQHTQLGREATCPVQKGQCRVELDSSRIMGFGVDKSHAIGGSWETGHSYVVLALFESQPGLSTVARCLKKAFSKRRRSANFATGPPQRMNAVGKGHNPAIRPRPD
jgi:hypothetical protein